MILSKLIKRIVLLVLGTSLVKVKLKLLFYKKLDNKEFKLISIIKYTFEEKITFELVDDEMMEVKKEIVVDSVNIDIK